MFVFSVRTWPAGSRPFPQSLPTPALDRHDTAAVWTLRLHDESGGPTSITGTARFVLAIFYIVITFLSGHTTPLISEEPLCHRSTPQSARVPHSVLIPMPTSWRGRCPNLQSARNDRAVRSSGPPWGWIVLRQRSSITV